MKKYINSKAAPYFVLVLSLLVSFLAWNYVREQIDTKQKAALNSLSRQVESAIKERMAIYIDAHHAGVGLFIANQSIGQKVKRREWKKFVKAMKLVERYPGINGLGYAAYVTNENKKSFEESVSVDGAPGFRIKPEGSRSDYFAIAFIEPIEANMAALGFDMGSEVNRRRAMERARDTGKTIISKSIILVQDSGKTPGFLSYVPFYKNGEMPDTIEARRKNFQGLIYAPFITKDFINGIFELELSELKDKVLLEIYDGKTLDNSDLIYRNSTDTKDLAHDKERQINLDLYGQNWIIKLNVKPGLYNLTEKHQDLIILVLGLLLSFLLFFLLRSISRTRDKALALAEEMTKEISVKNEMLERSNKELDAFAYIASHDLKEPLRTINSYSDLLEVYLKKKDLLVSGSKEAQFFHHISNGCSRMATLIAELLEFSRIGREKDNFEEVNPALIIHNVIDQLHKQIEDNDVEINFDENLPLIKANPTELHRIFQNLMSNAIKYRSQDKKAKLDIVYSKNGNDEHVFKVQDNGIGIAPEYFDQIFVLFKRLHTKNEYPGTGLGLAICKKSVEYHNGRIWLESEVNKGSTFYFSIGVN